MSPIVYRHAVPAPTLAKVRDMLDAVPYALFLVSDYETSKPDPSRPLPPKAYCRLEGLDRGLSD